MMRLIDVKQSTRTPRHHRSLSPELRTIALALACGALLIGCSASSQQGSFWGSKRAVAATEFQLEMQFSAAASTPASPTTAPATTRPTTAPATQSASGRQTTASTLPSGAPQPTKLRVDLLTGAAVYTDDEGKAWHYTLTPERVDTLREALAKGDWQTLGPANKPAEDLRFVLTAYNAGTVVGQPVSWPVFYVKGTPFGPQIPFNDAYGEAIRVAKPLSRKLDLTR